MISETLQPFIPTAKQLAGAFPTCPAETLESFIEPICAAMAAASINSYLRVAHFLTQVGHESMNLRFMEEISDGRQYEGRKDLGNTEPGDGPKFKGRGLIQLTGRANYGAYSMHKYRDFLAQPELIATDKYLCVDVAAWFWGNRSLNAFADRDELSAITLRVNGGLRTLPMRAARLARVKMVLAVK